MQILITIISGLCIAIPNIIATIATSRNNKRVSQDNAKLLSYRMDKLEDKVSVHNNLIDRMYKVESRVTLLEDNINDIKEK